MSEQQNQFFYYITIAESKWTKPYNLVEYCNEKYINVCVRQYRQTKYEKEKATEQFENVLEAVRRGELKEVNDSDFNHLLQQSDKTRKEFVEKKKRENQAQSEDACRGSQEHRPLRFRLKKEENGENSINLGTFCRFKNQEYVITDYDYHGRFHLKSIAHSSAFEVPAAEIDEDGEIFDTKFYIDEANGHLFSKWQNYQFDLDTLDLKQHDLLLANDLSQRDVEHLFPIGVFPNRIRVLNMNQIEDLHNDAFQETEVVICDNNSDGNPCSQKWKITSGNSDEHPGLICVQNEEPDEKRIVTIDSVYWPDHPPPILKKVEKGKSYYFTKEHKQQFVEVAYFKSPYSRNPVQTDDVLALLPIKEITNEDIKLKSKKFHFLKVYGEMLVMDEARRPELVFLKRKDLEPLHYLIMRTGDLVNWEGQGHERLPSEDLLFLQRVDSKKSRKRVFQTGILRFLKEKETIVIVRKDDTPTTADYTERSIERLQDGYVFYKVDDEVRSTTVDFIYMKVSRPFSFENCEKTLQFVFPTEEGPVLCVQPLFHVIYPDISEPVDEIPPRSDEKKIYTVVIRLHRPNLRSNFKNFLIPCLSGMPEKILDIVMSFKSTNLKDAGRFFLFTKDNAMTIWMEIDGHLHCLDGDERDIQRRGEFAPKDFSEIKDQKIVTLLLNVNMDQRKSLILSEQIGSEFERGEPLQFLIFKDAEVCYPISDHELANGTIKKFSLDKVFIEPESSTGEVEVFLHEIFRKDHSDCNIYSWLDNLCDGEGLIAVKIDEAWVLAIEHWRGDIPWKEDHVCGIECFDEIQSEEPIQRGLHFHYIQNLGGDENKSMFVEKRRTRVPEKFYVLLKPSGDLKAGSLGFEIDSVLHFHEKRNMRCGPPEQYDLKKIEKEEMFLALRIRVPHERLRGLLSGQWSGLDFQKGDLVYVKRACDSGHFCDLTKETIREDVKRGQIVTNKGEVSPENVYSRNYFDSSPSWFETAERIPKRTVELVDYNLSITIKEGVKIELPWEQKKLVVMILSEKGAKTVSNEKSRLREVITDHRFVNYWNVVSCAKVEALQLSENRIVIHGYDVDSPGNFFLESYDPEEVEDVSAEPKEDLPATISFSPIFPPGMTQERFDEVLQNDPVTWRSTDSPKGIRRLSSSCGMDNLIIAMFGLNNRFLKLIPETVNDELLHRLRVIIVCLREQHEVEHEKIFEFRKLLYDVTKGATLSDEPTVKNCLNDLIDGLEVRPMVHLSNETKHFIELLHEIPDWDCSEITTNLLLQWTLMNKEMHLVKVPNLLILVCDRRSLKANIKPDFQISSKRYMLREDVKKCTSCNKAHSVGLDFSKFSDKGINGCYCCDECACGQTLTKKHWALRRKSPTDSFKQLTLIAVIACDDGRHNCFVKLPPDPGAPNEYWLYHDHGEIERMTQTFLANKKPRNSQEDVILKRFYNGTVFIYQNDDEQIRQ